MPQSPLLWVVARVAMLTAALWLLRLELTSGLQITLGDAPAYGLYPGLLFDLIAATIVEIVGRAVAVGAPRVGRWTWGLLAVALFVATLSNVLYFKFFGSRLDYWILVYHLGDIIAVPGSAAQLGASSKILGGIGLLAAGVGGTAIEGRRRGRTPAPRRSRIIALALAVALLVVAVMINQPLLWHHQQIQKSRMLAEQICEVWFRQMIDRGSDLFDLSGVRSVEHDPERYRQALASSAEEIGAALAEFRDRDRSHALPSAPDERWPLHRPVAEEAAVGEALRARFGLGPGRINVILLFLESVRSYEVLHPELGPVIYPNLRRLLDEHAVWLPQVYTTSPEAGESVRGRFCTLCSMLPPSEGPAPYIAHPALKIVCLQGLFRENGFRTLWFNSHRKEYHNSETFERLHGTETFYDGAYFRSRGITQRIGSWGLADGPFLAETLKVLEELDASGERFFANVQTISTHHPFTVVPEGPLPDQLVAATEEHRYYRAYLSRLRYLDIALGEFFERFLASPLAERTLVVLVGDHSIRLDPHHEITELARGDMTFRTIMAFVSRDLQRPERLPWFAHQIDLAPSVQQIVQLDGSVSWLGRSALAAVGSSFMATNTAGLHYRTLTAACHLDPSGQGRCAAMGPEQDPLFLNEFEEVAPLPSDIDHFLRLSRATRQALVRNALMK